MEKSEAKTPIPNLPHEKREKEENLKSGIHENQISRKPEIMKSGDPETVKSGKPEIANSRKPEIPISRKAARKWSTQLAEGSILAIKRIALDEGKKDYEVLQEAVDSFLKSKTSNAS